MNRGTLAAVAVGTILVVGGTGAILAAGEPNGQGLIRDNRVCVVPASALQGEALRREISFALSRGYYEQARTAQLQLNALGTPKTVCTYTTFPTAVR